MFQKLRKAFTHRLIEDNNINAALIRERIDMNRRVANLVEHALVSGAYAGPQLADNGFMCIVLCENTTDPEAAMVARERIMARIYPNPALVSHMVRHGELNLTDDPFIMRIHCSNWFWSFINEQRDHADHLEQNCCPRQFNKVL
jgi:hypothetical protein